MEDSLTQKYLKQVVLAVAHCGAVGREHYYYVQEQQAATKLKSSNLFSEKNARCWA